MNKLTIWCCSICGPHNDSDSGWCAAGCGRDYQRMFEGVVVEAHLLTLMVTALAELEDGLHQAKMIAETSRASAPPFVLPNQIIHHVEGLKRGPLRRAIAAVMSVGDFRAAPLGTETE